MGNRGTLEDLCIAGENIKMRDINFTLQKQVGSLKERASHVGGERDTLSNNSIEGNVSKDLQGIDLVNFTEASEVDSELDSLRRRKRKQENINIHRVSSKIAHSKQTVLSQDKVGEAQEGLLEAMEVEQGILKVCDAAMGALQVCDSSQDLKRCKMKIEASPTHEVGFDTSTVAACALNDKLCLDLDIKVRSATALGFQHASCSITQWKDREGTGAVNNVREKASTCDEAVGTTIAASAVSRKELGSLMNLVLKNSGEMVSAAPTRSPRSCGLVDKFRTSLHNDYENRGKVIANVKEMSSLDQTENQRLKAALAALQSQFNVLSSLAEKGSSLPTTISCTVRVSKIPYTAVAEELVEFLNSSIGSDSVFACKIHTEKLNWKSRGFGFVQFETEAAASKAVELSRKCKLRFQQGLLQMEFEHRQIVDRPQIRVHCSSLYVGCLMSSNVFCALWSAKTLVTIELDCVKGKLALLLDSTGSDKKYKLTWKLTSLDISGTQKEKEKSSGNFFLLLQAKYAPKIQRKIAENRLKRGKEFMSDRYSFFRDNPEDQEHPWCRCADFIENRCIEQSSSYYLEIPAAEEHLYHFFTKRLLSVQAFEVSENISIQMGGDVKHLQDRGLKKIVPSKLNDGLIQVNRLTITPTKIYSLGPEIEVSNRVIRHYMDSMQNFIRVHFTDEDMSALSARALEISPDKFLKSRVRSERTEIYHRIHKILEEGIELGGKRFEFLAFSSSQLREHSFWMFASGGTATADSIRSWMGNFTNFKNVASCAARMGQCFSASKKGPDVYEREIEEIPDVEIVSGGIKYCFSDGIGKISPMFAREVAVKCGYKSRGRKAPSAFQIRHGGYKGVVAIDPMSSYKLSLRPSMKKFESKLIALDVLEWTRFLPCYLNRQVITLLSTLGVEDHVFERMQKERISSLDGVLTNEDAPLRMLQVSCAGEYHRVTVEMLLAGYHPRDEPFLYSMLQAFKAAQIHQICKKSKIFVPSGRVLMGCLDETACLSYGEVFVKISTDDVEHDSAYVIQGKVVVAKNPCLHPGDIRVLQAVDSPNLQHMVDCIVFPQKGSRPHPNECSGSDLDGDLYFVTWDEKLIPPTIEMPMDYYPPNSISLDHPPTLKEIQTYFVDYMSNDSLGTIANAHVVFADKEPEKARSWQCKELAELASIAVDFPKTGVPAILPKYLRPHSYPDFLEKSGKKTYISSGIIGKLYRAAREASAADALTRCAKDFGEFYDKDLVVKGLEKYVEKALVYKKLYNEKLTTLMEFYGVLSEAEMLTGFFSELRPTMSNASKKVEDRIQKGVSALQIEAKNWFEGMQGGGDDNQEYAIASAWYHVTYHPEFLHESSCLRTDEAPLFSFPWVNYDKLFQIKRFNKLVKDL